MGGVKVAVYAIALNEAQFVTRWAESAIAADYRIMLDTGSTDDTVALAQAHGVTVEVQRFSPWRFDHARNAALALVPEDTDVCVALDMDEVLAPGWREHLEQAFLDGVTRPRYTYTWSWSNGQPDLQYGGDKIHARHGYRWKHPVHEVLVPEGEERQGWVGLEIHHHPDHTKSRGQYFPLLELAVAEDPEDDRNSHYLAREYFFHGMFDKAAAEFKRHLSLPRSAWAPERSASMRYLAKCEPHHREAWLLRAAAECPERREAWVDLAFVYYQRQDWLACLAACRRALTIREKPLEYLCDAVAWGSVPHDLASVSAFHLGMHGEALRYGTEALALAPDDERLKANVGLYQSAV